LRGEAQALMMLGRGAEARLAAEQILESAPEDVDALMLAASARFEAGDPAAALEALRRLGPGALPEMERAFAAGALGADERRLMVDLAGRLEDPSARRLLLAGLDDPSPAVRAEAAAALGEGGFREALRPLIERKEGDPSPDVRRAAAYALRKLQPR